MKPTPGKPADVGGSVERLTAEALAPLWALDADAAQDIFQDPAYNAFKAFCIQTFETAGWDLGLSFALHDALRGIGLPCLSPPGTTNPSLADAARALVYAFEAKTVRRRYLCPLNLADDLPPMQFGHVSVRRHGRDELSELMDGERLARFFPSSVRDIRRLADLQWLVVEETEQADGSAGRRAMPDFYETWSRGRSFLDPHAVGQPAAVTDALFGLMLAPWEDWHSMEHDWRACSVPWVHVATDDLFVRPQRLPSPDTLAWEPAFHDEPDGSVFEYERPIQLDLHGDAASTLSTFDDAWWDRIQIAERTALFETPVKHFMVRASFADGFDQIMAHMSAIEAALGLKGDGQKGQNTKDGIGPSKRVTKRIERLLDDEDVGEDYSTLFQLRSEFVHGRAMAEPIPSGRLALARRIARRVVVALVDAAVGPAGSGTRKDFLNSLA